jgi:hypothetical protein
MMVINPLHQTEWIGIKKPPAAFALPILEAVDMPAAKISLGGLSTLQRGNELSRPDRIPIDRPVKSSFHIQIRISNDPAMAGRT